MSAILTVPKASLHVVDYDDTFAGKAPRSKEHFALYCALVLGFRLPSPALCKDHNSPLDVLWSVFTDEVDFAIIQAMRGSGKTFLLAALAYLETVFKPYCGTTILGGSLEQSQKAVKYLCDLWDLPDAPRHMLKNGTVAGRGYELTNGSWVAALAASQKSVRGPHPQKLRLDEVDEMDQAIFDAALGQPKAGHGIKDQVVASSTLHNPFGMMSTLIDNRHERGATLYQWCVEEVREPRGFWTDDELERKKRQLTEAMWDAEYLLKRPSMAETVFDFEQVEKAWERGRRLKIEKIPTEAGVDWGHGTTILHLVQDTKERYSLPKTFKWNYVELTDRCEQIVRICKEYKIEKLYADSNPKDSNITLHRVIKKYGLQTKVHAVAFGKYKTIGIEVLRYLFERDLIDITDKSAKECFQKFHYRNIDTEQIDKVDDHEVDAAIAWAASRARLLGMIK